MKKYNNDIYSMYEVEVINPLACIKDIYQGKSLFA